jgi:predicted 2-oxoglutarate/Fe(II)-dependent dioxygenase YbiX
MNKIYINPDIFYVENFLSEEEISILKNEAEENNWVEQSKDLVLTDEWSGKIKNIKNKELFSLIRKRIFESIDENKNLSVMLGETIRRYLPTNNENEEWAMGPHHDGQEDPWLFGAIVYINDNYEGGEIVYTNLNIEIKPKPGMVILHKANENTVHAVKKIISGERYVLSFFIGDPTNEKLKNKVIL